MVFITHLLDTIWNLKFLTGYRTEVARVALVGLTAYQGMATSKDLIAIGVHLPLISSGVFVGLTAYFALKMKQFVDEHKP